MVPDVAGAVVVVVVTLVRCSRRTDATSVDHSDGAGTVDSSSGRRARVRVLGGQGLAGRCRLHRSHQPMKQRRRPLQHVAHHFTATEHTGWARKKRGHFILRLYVRSTP